MEVRSAFCFASFFTTHGVSGDDKCVRVWSTDDYRCSQTIESPKWGQVTALTWIWAEPPTHASLNSVCVGTGRGCVSVCPVLKTTNVSFMKSITQPLHSHTTLSGSHGRMLTLQPFLSSMTQWRHRRMILSINALFLLVTRGRSKCLKWRNAVSVSSLCAPKDSNSPDKAFLKPLWTTAISNAIPRSLHFFGGANQSLLTHSLETGEM